jgi:hypothetical protein
MVGKPREAARYTGEFGLSLAVSFIDIATSRTSARRVARIDRDHRHAVQLGFVLDKAAELEKRPAMQCCSLRPTNRYPITDTAKFLYGDSPIGVFGLSDNAFADIVVCPSSELPFLTGELFQTTARGLRSFGLELLAQLAMAIPNVLDRFALVNGTVTIDGDISDSEVNAEETIRIDCWRFVNIACRQKVKLSIAIDKIGLTALAMQHNRLTVPANECHLLATVKRPNRDGILVRDNAQDAIIEGDTTQQAKRALGVLVDLVRVCDFGHNTNRRLSGQSESRTNGVVSGMVQVVLPELLCIPSQIAQIVGGTIRRIHCPLERISLLFSWLQLDLRNQFHGLNTLLVLYVLLDYRQRSAANRGDKVAVCPKRRKSAFEFREFLTQQTGTATLHQLDQGVDAELRIDAHQNVYMVGHNLNLDQVAPRFGGHIAQDLFQPFVDAIYQHATPILRAPNDMVSAYVGDVVV